MSIMDDYLKENSNDSVKFEKNSSITVKILTSEPVFSIPVFLYNTNGKTKRVNSIAWTRKRERTSYKCPFIPLNVDNKGKHCEAKGQFTWPVLNCDLGTVQMMKVSQFAILRGFQALEEQIAKQNKAKGAAKTLSDFKIVITRTDSSNKVDYGVSFAVDAAEPLTAKEQAVIDAALDDENENNIWRKIDRETQWPDQEYLDDQNIPVRLPPEFVNAAEKELEADAIPF